MGNNKIKKNRLFPIGIGTWGIGGLVERDNSVDLGKQTDAITYMFEKGMNFVEANTWYSEGSSVEILSKAFKKSSLKRDDIFICQSLYPKGKKLDEMGKDVDKILELFETDHVDTVQFSQSTFLEEPFEKIVEFIDSLFEKKIINYTSITNEDLPLLIKYHEHFKDRLFSHEICFNFEIRENEKLGIIPYANQNDILNVVYQPLRRNRTAKRNWDILIKLSQKYGKTQNQILLNWIVSKGYLPLTKSETISHIDENLDSLTFKMENKDYELLNNYTIKGYTSPKIDWNRTGDGIKIVQLSDSFDEIYDNKSENRKV